MSIRNFNFRNILDHRPLQAKDKRSKVGNFQFIIN